MRLSWGAMVSGAFQGRFGHGGAFGYQSDSTGLQLLGHRYYDPAVGRFLTPDPIKDGRNWYAYCENNPLNRTDPGGLSLEAALNLLKRANVVDPFGVSNVGWSRFLDPEWVDSN